MQPDTILEAVLSIDDDLVLKRTWGESSVFYNPGGASAHGKYVLTVKDRDGPNDKASRLDRDGVFRVSIGLTRGEYAALLGPAPKRPPKGSVVQTGHDFTRLGVWLPHPVYAWMSWACILCPCEADRDELLRLATIGLDRARRTALRADRLD
ncbi:DUF6194 family protein [Gemmata sp.]|uniref:DUF6194 family protein n=1 Tax=Gemmata sp. TaxID=1914242 RepID=UPI003F701AD5